MAKDKIVKGFYINPEVDKEFRTTCKEFGSNPSEIISKLMKEFSKRNYQVFSENYFNGGFSGYVEQYNKK